MVSNTPTLNVTQQQGRAPQGQISFGRNSKSNLAPQGQQIPSSNQSPLLVAGAPPIGILRTTSANAKGANSSVPVLQSQHGDNSLTGSGQKTSPEHVDGVVAPTSESIVYRLLANLMVYHFLPVSKTMAAEAAEL
ncbi:hypothetical protein GH714_037009 [Hevea brasiliensis]|uniref:Uncharacterized protein n=1 Tax=Hevea brasiliensis TaxID=3981 RepID=A0A6A6MM77_HEVBR|nr:hypothetical protein GH714_037009 [Hevea brasiliensis]